MYKRWRVYSTFLTGLLIGLACALLLSAPSWVDRSQSSLIEWEVLTLAFFGILGGVIYPVVVNGFVEMPRYFKGKGDAFKAGLFGDILLGIAGAFILSFLLPSEFLNSDLESPSSSAIATIGIVGGYGGRAIIQFSIERFFKTAEGLYGARADILEQQIERQRARYKVPVVEVSSLEGEIIDPVESVDASIDENVDSASQALALIEQVDDYIQAGLSEAEWLQVVQQLQDASESMQQSVFSALVDLRQMSGSEQLTSAQLLRLGYVLEALASCFKLADHPVCHQLGLLFRDVSPPDYSKALSALDLAIAHRGALTVGQPWQYELDRAVVNIQMDIQSGQAHSPALETSQKLSVLTDLLAIANVYNLDTILKAAELQQIPELVLDWLRRNQSLLESRQDTRSIMVSLSPLLSQSRTVPASPSSDQVPKNPKGVKFPKIYAALGSCYDILELDPLALMSSAKATRVFDFYPGEAASVLDENKTIPIPKNTRYIPGSRGSSYIDAQTKILYTESDVQKLFSSGFGGQFGSAITRLVGAVLPFSLSASYANFKQTRTAEKSVCAFTKYDYVHYELDLNLEVGRSLWLNRNFRSAVAQLPLTAATTYAYIDFIDKFGTHLSTQVTYGGLVHHSVQLNQSVHASVVRRGIDLAGEAKKVFQAKYRNQSQDSAYREISERSESLVFCGGNEGADDWVASVKQDPAPIHLDLLPLHEILTDEFFPEDRQIAQKRSLLATTTQAYLENNSPPLIWEPWASAAVGGDRGRFFSDLEMSPHLREAHQARYQKAQVKEVRVWIKNWIECVQVVLDDDEMPPLLAHGSEDGTLNVLTLAPGDYITGVEVMTAAPELLGRKRGGPYVGSLRLRTHQKREWVVGTPDEEPVSLDIPDGYQVIGFHGRTDKYIDKLGVISIPRL